MPVNNLTDALRQDMISSLRGTLNSSKELLNPTVNTYTTTERGFTDENNGVSSATFGLNVPKTPDATKAKQATPSQTAKTSRNFDWRARLRPKDGGKSTFYGSAQDSLMALIKQSNGLIWQYTPSLTFQSSANYHKPQMQGMNYSINTYNLSEVQEITLNSEFTANDIYEAQYMLAAFNFLKISTKSYFGDAATAQGRYGTPPPVMLFEYLGEQMFNKVPVVVSSYNITFSDSVDYVPVIWQDTTTYVPTQAQVMVSMLPTYNPNKIRQRFDLDQIKNGQAYKYGFI